MIYTNISSNVRKTWLLMSLFFVFIIAIGWLFSYLCNSQDILIFAVVISVVSSFTSYWFSDKIVLGLSHAQEIKKQDAPELYRLVENLSITAGLPLPRIYIIDESAPNAFATGRDKNHAVIAVTHGLLEKLEKVELEGVIAHELSHIGNKDMLLQTMVVVLAGAIAMLSNMFLRMNFFRGARRRNNNREGGQLELILMVFTIVAVILAPIAATLIRLAISRKREFLADASGAMLTRYPEGLALALEKISADPNPVKVASNATAHLYIANPLSARGGSPPVGGQAAFGEKENDGTNWLNKLFMTHPSINERIKALREMSA